MARLALLVGLAATYWQWSVYLTLRASPEASHRGRANWGQVRFKPTVWAGLVVSPRRMANGTSEVNGLSIDNEPLRSRWYLVLFWGAEALFIVGLACAGAGAQAEEPFSEATDAWAVAELMPRPVSHVRDPAALRAALEAGNFEALELLPTKATAPQMLGRPPAALPG